MTTPCATTRATTRAPGSRTLARLAAIGTLVAIATASGGWAAVGGARAAGAALAPSGSAILPVARLTESGGAQIGAAVAISGSTAVATGGGAAYVFARHGGHWAEEATLTAPDGGPIGASVAVAGSKIVVGAPDQGSGTGAAYVFVLAEGTWTEQAEIVASDGAPADAFGASVAIVGNRAVVGAPGHGGGVGAAYLFALSNGSWTQQAELVASDGAPGDAFGDAVAVDLKTVFVGADGRDSGMGAAYAFVRTKGSWAQQAELVAADGSPGDTFGASLVVSSSLVAIGAPGAGSGAGIAYAFRGSHRSWSQAGEIAPADASPADRFGGAVALSGSEVIAGAPGHAIGSGAAYLFTAVGPVWAQGSQLTSQGGGPGDGFGSAAAASGPLALVGAPGEGAVYVVTLPDQKAALAASDATAGAMFGSSAAVAGPTAIVGAPGAASGSGAVYVFGRKKHGWAQRAELVADDGAPGDAFGASLTISGNTVLVGAPGADSGTGAVYVFEYAAKTKSWSQQARLAALDRKAGDAFGTAVSLSDISAFVGAPGRAGGAGAAYAYSGAGPSWAQVTEFTDPKGTAGDAFGRSVTVSKSTAVVGAPGTAGSGAAYAYLGSWTAWYFDAKLTAADHAPGDGFGEAVSLDGSTVLVGAPGANAAAGAAALFQRAKKWQQIAGLEAVAGSPGDRFGSAVDLSSGTAAIAAAGAVGGSSAGSVYVFEQDGSVWTQDALLAPSDGGAPGDLFGCAVGLSGGLVIAGADGADGGAGAAYLIGIG